MIVAASMFARDTKLTYSSIHLYETAKLEMTTEMSD